MAQGLEESDSCFQQNFRVLPFVFIFKIGKKIKYISAKPQPYPRFVVQIVN